MVKKHLTKLKGRPRDTHKRDFGHVFVVAGSAGMTGAAFLAAQAAIRSGSGVVTCGIPKSLNPVMEVKLTEVMTLPLAETKYATLALSSKKDILSFSEKCDVIALGPGISRHEETLCLARALIKDIKRPLVLDADGIIALAGNTASLRKRKHATVITPHPGEMAKVLSTDTHNVQKNREKTALSFAKRHGVVTVLKGYRTVVADPAGEIYVNTTGNSGMSTAGAGDVLTGMLASFIGQGLDSYSASVIAVYIHGIAGDIAAREKGIFGMIAGDILECVPQAIREVV